jgi:hypothetical protein
LLLEDRELFEDLPDLFIVWLNFMWLHPHSVNLWELAQVLQFQVHPQAQYWSANLAKAAEKRPKSAALRGCFRGTFHCTLAALT